MKAYASLHTHEGISIKDIPSDFSVVSLFFSYHSIQQNTIPVGRSKEMGSYMSIVNNTEFDFNCMVTLDYAALRIFNDILGVVAVLGSIAISLGFYTPIVVTLIAPELAIVTGISPAITAAVGTSAVSYTALSLISHLIDEQLGGKGFKLIKAKDSYKFGPMTLSLWQQGHCIRKREVEENGEMFLIVDNVYMRPIFSGATAGSNLNHDIQFWIDKFGFQDEFWLMEGKSNPSQSPNHNPSQSPGGVVVLEAPNRVPSSTPSQQPSGSSSPSGSPSTTVKFKCNVCEVSATGSVTSPNTTVFIPKYGRFTCAEIEAAGNDGLIDEVECPLVVQYLRPCGCFLPYQQCFGFKELPPPPRIARPNVVTYFFPNFLAHDVPNSDPDCFSDILPHGRTYCATN